MNKRDQEANDEDDILFEHEGSTLVASIDGREDITLEKQEFGRVIEKIAKDGNFTAKSSGKVEKRRDDNA